MRVMIRSTRTKQTIAGVAETGKNVSVCVEFSVQRCRYDTHVGMFVREILHTFWCSDETEKSNSCRSRTLQRRHSRRSASSRGEHRVEQEEITLGGITGDFEVVVDRLQRVVIAIQADVSNARRWNQSQHTFNHSESRTQNWNESQLLATDAVTDGAFKRRVHWNFFQWQRTRGFIGEKHREFINKFLEDLRWCVAAAQQCNLVLHQRMSDEREVRVQRAGVHVRQATNFARMAEYRAPAPI
jgi:hypothetical protein